MDGQLVTLSDLYRQDLPEGALFVPEHAISAEEYSDGVQVAWHLQNTRGKFNMLSRAAQRGSLDRIVFSPQRIMSVTGDFLHLFVTLKPPQVLSSHWIKVLGNKGELKWGEFGDETKKHITMSPLENLDKTLHAVDPSSHFETLSKLFIPKIPVSQPVVQEVSDPRFPCVVKTSLGSGGRGVFMVHTQSEFNKVLNDIKEAEPTAEVLVTDMIQCIKDNYCCQFYLNKKGEMMWLGVTDQTFDEDGHWAGGTMHLPSQENLEQLLKPTMYPVAAKLHEYGYFGVVGVDVLVDNTDKQYVIDVNPRINGSTSMLLISRLMAKKKWTYGLLANHLDFVGGCEELFTQIENMSGGDAVVLGMTQGTDFLYSAAVFSDSLENCYKCLPSKPRDVQREDRE